MTIPVKFCRFHRVLVGARVNEIVDSPTVMVEVYPVVQNLFLENWCRTHLRGLREIPPDAFDVPFTVHFSKTFEDEMTVGTTTNVQSVKDQEETKAQCADTSIPPAQPGSGTHATGEHVSHESCTNCGSPADKCSCKDCECQVCSSKTEGGKAQTIEPPIQSATSSTMVCGGNCVAAAERAAAGGCPACECPAKCPCTKCGCPICGRINLLRSRCPVPAAARRGCV